MLNFYLYIFRFINFPPRKVTRNCGIYAKTEVVKVYAKPFLLSEFAKLRILIQLNFYHGVETVTCAA